MHPATGRPGTRNQGVHACTVSCFRRVLTLRPHRLARQAPVSMGFSTQEYRSGLPCRSPGDLPDPGIEPEFPALAGGFFTIRATWEAKRSTSDVPASAQRHPRGRRWLVRGSQALEFGDLFRRCPGLWRTGQGHVGNEREEKQRARELPVSE